MCTSAIIKSGIKEIYTGVLDKKIKDTELTAIDVIQKSKNKIYFETGVLKEEIKKQLKDR
jgi:tRNA(Arg) A34 adenosine deaminase TadA